MPFALFLALRYLRSPVRGRAARVTSVAAILGVACSVAAYILASALAAGFRDEMQDKILRGTAHISVAPSTSATGANADFVQRKIATVEGVRTASRTTYTGALLIGETANAYAVVRAVDPTSAHALEELRRTLIAGRIEEAFTRDTATAAAASTESSPAVVVVRETPTGDDNPNASPIPVIIGAELAAQTGLVPGATARIIAADSSVIAADSSLRLGAELPRVTLVRVAGIFRAGLHDYDATWIYLPLASALTLGTSPGGAPLAPVISVETQDVYRAEEIALRLRERLGADWRVVTWGEANAALFAALELERRTVGWLISLVSIIASLNILTTLVLLVSERRRHIAILGALGARPRSIILVFVIEGATLGTLGALIGVALGLCGCLLGNAYELIHLPSDVYSISTIPFHPRASDVLLATAGALLISLLATIYPARTAARVRPGLTLK